MVVYNFKRLCLTIYIYTCTYTFFICVLDVYTYIHNTVIIILYTYRVHILCMYVCLTSLFYFSTWYDPHILCMYAWLTHSSVCFLITRSHSLVSYSQGCSMSFLRYLAISFPATLMLLSVLYIHNCCSRPSVRWASKSLCVVIFIVWCVHVKLTVLTCTVSFSVACRNIKVHIYSTNQNFLMNWQYLVRCVFHVSYWNVNLQS